MVALLLVVHVVVCIIMIFIVLLQSGKGAEMGASFGGASQTVFGSSGPTDFLGKLTTWSAGIFMVTSLTLAFVSSGKSTPSVVDKVPIAAEQPAAEVPAAPQGIDKALPPVEQGTQPSSVPPAPQGKGPEAGAEAGK